MNWRNILRRQSVARSLRAQWNIQFAYRNMRKLTKVSNENKCEIDRVLDKFVLLEGSVLLAGGFKVQHWHDMRDIINTEEPNTIKYS